MHYTARAKKELALLNSAAAGKISGMTGMALNGIESRVTASLRAASWIKGWRAVSSWRSLDGQSTGRRGRRRPRSAREEAELWNWKGAASEGAQKVAWLVKYKFPTLLAQTSRSLSTLIVFAYR